MKNLALMLPSLEKMCRQVKIANEANIYLIEHLKVVEQTARNPFCKITVL